MKFTGCATFEWFSSDKLITDLHMNGEPIGGIEFLSRASWRPYVVYIRGRKIAGGRHLTLEEAKSALLTALGITVEAPPTD